MDTRAWFDDGRYSDLTIKLSEGPTSRSIRSLCVRKTSISVNFVGLKATLLKLPSIVLKDDDPVALKDVLRWIYSLELTEDFSPSTEWRYWLNIRTTADKYLEPKLSKCADEHFRTVVDETTDPEMIFDIIDTIEIELAHDDSLVELSNDIRKKHYAKLLKNDRFRAKLGSGDQDALWKVIDELVFAADLKEKCYHLCRAHEGKLFHEPGGDKGKTALCTFCQSLHLATRSPAHAYSAGPQQEERTIWTQK